MNQDALPIFALFDGRSSSANGDQFLFSHGPPLTTPESTRTKMIARVLETTGSFGAWTDAARLLAASPALAEVCRRALADLEALEPEHERIDELQYVIGLVEGRVPFPSDERG